ncbi:MAG: hypothetical protein KDB01_23965 [Planctomycetaceae bacterium]|nr:hypothetical protein [Planctomycetaceae bacterium]
MNSFTVRLRLRSGLGTPLKAQTLWGHLCWGIRYCQGNEALEDWLSRYDQGTPPLILSDPFPAGFRPRPCLPGVVSSDVPTREDADRRKSVNRIRWLSTSSFDSLRKDMSPEHLMTILSNKVTQQPAAMVESSMTHAGINRLTGGTEQPDGGALFTSSATFCYTASPREQAGGFDVLVRSPESTETIHQWFRDGLQAGYGRDAATGMGQIEVTEVHADQLPPIPEANAVMLLSSAVPRRGDPHRGYFSIGVHSGRVGGDFAVGLLPDGSSNRQKYPVRTLVTGTVLMTENAALPWVGQVLSGIHSWDGLRHYGLGLTIPVRIPATLCESSF